MSSISRSSLSHTILDQIAVAILQFPTLGRGTENDERIKLTEMFKDQCTAVENLSIPTLVEKYPVGARVVHFIGHSSRLNQRDEDFGSVVSGGDSSSLFRLSSDPN